MSRREKRKFSLTRPCGAKFICNTDTLLIKCIIYITPQWLYRRWYRLELWIQKRRHSYLNKKWAGR